VTATNVGSSTDEYEPMEDQKVLTDLLVPSQKLSVKLLFLSCLISLAKGSPMCSV